MAGRTRGGANPADDQDLAPGLDNQGRGSRVGLIIFVILGLAIIGILIATLGLNAFGVRDEHIFPFLRNVPLVGQLVPVGEYIYIDGEPVEIPSDPAELEIIINELAEQLEEVRAELAMSQALNAEYSHTVNVLQAYRDAITEYRENSRLFDEMIAMGDPDAFAAFFEQIDPENAARLYTHIRAEREIDREFRRFAATYAEMNIDEAAEVFTLLLTQNTMLLLDILHTFNTAQRAAIFNEMEPSDVAIITILMEPDTLPEDILPPVPVIDGGITPIQVITAPDDTEEEVNEDGAEDETEDEYDEEV